MHAEAPSEIGRILILFSPSLTGLTRAYFREHLSGVSPRTTEIRKHVIRSHRATLVVSCFKRTAKNPPEARPVLSDYFQLSALPKAAGFDEKCATVPRFPGR